MFVLAYNIVFRLSSSFHVQSLSDSFAKTRVAFLFDINVGRLARHTILCPGTPSLINAIH